MSGATKSEVRIYMKTLMSKTWKKLNKERACANSQYLREFIDYAMDMDRMAQLMYGTGDAYVHPHMSKSHSLSCWLIPFKGCNFHHELSRYMKLVYY